MKMRSSPGFSMMEILVVIVIIGFLATMVGPRVVNLLRSGKTTATQSTLTGLKAAILDYQMQIGNYPKSLQHLVENVDNNPKWQGPYLEGQKEVPLDKWNGVFIYNNPPKVFLKEYRTFELISYGEKGEAATPEEYLKQGA